MVNKAWKTLLGEKFELLIPLGKASPQQWPSGILTYPLYKIKLYKAISPLNLDKDASQGSRIPTLHPSHAPFNTARFARSAAEFVRL